MKNVSILVVFLSIAALVYGSAVTASAATLSIATGDWGNGGTWDLGEPGFLDDVSIGGGDNVTVTAAGEVGQNLQVGHAGDPGTGTLTMTSGTLGVLSFDVGPSNTNQGTVIHNGGDITTISPLFVRNGGVYTMNGGKLEQTNPAGVNHIGLHRAGTLVINGGLISLAGNLNLAQETTGGVPNRVTLEIHNTGHLELPGKTLVMSVRGDTKFNMDGGEFDSGGINFEGSHNLGQFTTMTMSGGQFDVTGRVLARSTGQFDWTMEGGYGSGSSFNVGQLELLSGVLTADQIASGTPSRLTALLDANGIEPINVTNASSLGDTKLVDMELGVGALGASTLGDILGVHDFVISTGPIDDFDLVLVELSSLTALGGSASYAIVNNGSNSGLGETLQITVTGVPEPGSFFLAVASLLGLGFFGRRRCKRS